MTALAELGAFASVAAHVFEDGSSDETLPALGAWGRAAGAVPLKITTVLELLGGEARTALRSAAMCSSRRRRKGSASWQEGRHDRPPCDPPT